MIAVAFPVRLSRSRKVSSLMFSECRPRNYKSRAAAWLESCVYHPTTLARVAKRKARNTPSNRNQLQQPTRVPPARRDTAQHERARSQPCRRIRTRRSSSSCELLAEHEHSKSHPCRRIGSRRSSSSCDQPAEHEEESGRCIPHA